MNKVFTLILTLLLTTNVAIACDSGLCTYLDEAKKIAVNLPQINSEQEGNRNIDDEYWIRDPELSKIGGYRYLLHDIAVGYSKIACWEKGLQTVDLIKNLGVKDSAWAQISIEYAKTDKFDDAMKLIKAIKYPAGGEIARKYVAKELVRAGRIEEAREVLRGAGLFDNHYESFFYQNAMNLANAGKHDEAFEYTKKRHHENQHVHNALGDMLLLFQEKGDIKNCEKIISYYETNKTKNIPLYQLANYYLKKGQIDKAKKYTLRIDDPQTKAITLLRIAEAQPKDINDTYNLALNIIDKEYRKDPKNNWTIIVHTVYDIYKLKGQKISNKFLYKYIEKKDYIAEIGHKNIIKQLFSSNKSHEVISYLNALDYKLESDAYIRSIAQLRVKSATKIPNIDAADNNAFTYSFIIIEALKSKCPEQDVLRAVLNNYTNENSAFQKAELLRIIAMMASKNMGHKVAVGLYDEKDNPLLRAYWLIGISQANQADEIHDALRYQLYL
jgi:hypothetical protein